ncbi:sugar ABC transporter substrate-binding protein [Candidatus Bipolaricaulota bacterium]|nr:sugar ABC transporter substrate-binding protein [Candidatus Bipolaricaulota bacterium]
MCNRNRVMVVVAASLVTLLCVGAVFGADAVRIGYVSIAANCTGQARAIEATRDACAELGWQVDVVDGAGDFSKITSAFENFINAGVDALIAGAIDPEPLKPVIAQANAAGIPFFMESSLWVPGVTCMVGMDSFRMGTIQAQYVIDRLGGSGNVLILTYPPARDVDMREQVFRTVLSFYPEIEILNSQNVEISRVVDESMRTMETWLLRYPDIDAVWCGWDDVAMGAIAAIDVAGRDGIVVIGNDGGEEAQAKIADPNCAWDVTVYVDYETMGRTMIEQIAKYLDTGSVDARNIYVDLPLLTPANVPGPGETFPEVDTYFLYTPEE